MTGNDFTFTARNKALFSVLASIVCTDQLGELIDVETTLQELAKLFERNKIDGGSIYLIGNGGSAAVANHAMTDFVNVSRLRAFTLHDSILMTCMANDFGYEDVFKRILNTVLKKHDVIIAISSSGKSANICQAAELGKASGNKIITLSGFATNNPLRKIGDFNIWLDSNDYGLIEIGHSFFLQHLVDRDREAVASKDKEKLNYLASFA